MKTFQQFLAEGKKSALSPEIIEIMKILYKQGIKSPRQMQIELEKQGHKLSYHAIYGNMHKAYPPAKDFSRSRLKEPDRITVLENLITELKHKIDYYEQDLSLAKSKLKSYEQELTQLKSTQSPPSPQPAPNPYLAKQQDEPVPEVLPPSSDADDDRTLPSPYFGHGTGGGVRISRDNKTTS